MNALPRRVHFLGALLVLGAAPGLGQAPDASRPGAETAAQRPVFGKGGWKAPVDPKLPNVLLIGDSISVGYTREVRHLLRSQANVLRPADPVRDAPVNCASTQAGLKSLPEWLGNTKWAVIHFNWGLHDLCYRHPESKEVGQRDKVRGKISVPPEQYERNLRELVGKLKATGACLVWANTTYVPEGEAGRFQGDDRKYNAIAAGVMAEYGIPTDDLFAITSRFGPSMFLGPGNVHFTAEANWILAEQVAKSVKAALERCGGSKRMVE